MPVRLVVIGHQAAVVYIATTMPSDEAPSKATSSMSPADVVGQRVDAVVVEDREPIHVLTAVHVVGDRPGTC